MIGMLHPFYDLALDFLRSTRPRRGARFSMGFEKVKEKQLSMATAILIIIFLLDALAQGALLCVWDIEKQLDVVQSFLLFFSTRTAPLS